MRDDVVDEAKLAAQRETWRTKKADQRARTAEEKAQAILAGNPDGYMLPPVPAGLRALRKWMRTAADAYHRGRKISPLELAEARRTVSTLSETYKVGAALRSAEAQQRMAEVLASIEHGGQAVLLLERLQAGLQEGRRRPLPPRVVPSLPPDGAA